MRNLIFIIAMLFLAATILFGLEGILSSGIHGLLKKSKVVILTMLGYVVLYSVYIFTE